MTDGLRKLAKTPKPSALLAANANSIAQAMAIAFAGRLEGCPAVLQVSQTVLVADGGSQLVRFVRSLRDEEGYDLSLHLDHGLTHEVCVHAIDQGFDSVMIDGSYRADGLTPRTFAENLEVTARVVEWAHARGKAVEGALGLVGSLTSCLGHTEDENLPVGPFPRDAFLTDPSLAREFVAKTSVDALAIAVGTTHGPVKFDHEPSIADLDLERVSELRDALPGVLLVMHGSSSVPAYLQDQINAFGGEAPKAWGLPIPVVQEAIRRGVGKINVDTDLRMAMTAGLRRYLSENPSETNPRLIEAAARDEMIRLCRQKIRDFRFMD